MPRRLLLLALLCPVVSSVAQSPVDSTSRSGRDWLIGVSAGIPGYDKQAAPELFTIGVNASQIKPGRLGADLSLGTMPRAFIEGVGVLGGRAGAVFPIAPTPDVLLLPSAGLSLVGGGGGDGGGAIGGFNAGLAAVIWSGDVGVRTGVTVHRFADLRGTVWLVEFGVVRGK